MGNILDITQGVDVDEVLAATAPPIERSKLHFISHIHAEQWWIDQSRANPGQCMTYLSDGVLRPADIHLEWLYYFFHPKYTRVAIVGFPGSAKTSCIVFAYAYLIGKKPWLTNIIASVSENQAKDRLRAVREIIDLNPRYKNVFPWIHIDNVLQNDGTHLNVWASRWGEKGTVELDRQQYRNHVGLYGQPRDHTLFAAGITSKSVIGKRVTGILGIDDPHDEENSANEDQRTKVVALFRKTFLTRLVPNSTAKCFLITNRWAETDLYGRLGEDMRRDGTPVWKMLSTPIEDEDGNPTWPEVWNEDAIDARAEEVGGKDSPVWKLSYLNKADGLASGEITDDMLRLALPDGLTSEIFKELYITADFAESEGLRADWTVFLAVARDKEKPFNYYILDGRRFKKNSIKGKIDDLAEFWASVYGVYGKRPKVLFEHNDSDAEAQRLAEDYPEIQYERVKTKGDKEMRFKQVAGRAQIGRMYINTSMEIYPALKSEMLSFPRGKHDDIVDAASLPFNLDSWHKQRIRARTRYVESPHLLSATNAPPGFAFAPPF